MNDETNPIVEKLYVYPTDTRLRIKVTGPERDLNQLLEGDHPVIERHYTNSEIFKHLTGPEDMAECNLDREGVFTRKNPDGSVARMFLLDKDSSLGTENITDLKFYVQPYANTNTAATDQNANQNNTEWTEGGSSNPLDQFSIKEFLSLNFLDSINFSLTNFGLYLILASLIILSLFFLSSNYGKIKSNNWSGGQESLYSTIHGIVINQINDKKGQMFFSFIFTIFVFILCCNLIGMVPYNFASTSHFIYTFSLSFTIVIGATILALAIHQLKLFSLFVPQGCPLALLVLLVLIEFISYIARNVSLGLRLAANILSGHMLLNILSGFTYKIMNSGYIYLIIGVLPFIFIIAFSGLEVGIAFIQAQVFAVLSSSYIKDGFSLH